jgi:hypothetical protein
VTRDLFGQSRERYREHPVLPLAFGGGGPDFHFLKKIPCLAPLGRHTLKTFSRVILESIPGSRRGKKSPVKP